MGGEFSAELCLEEFFEHPTHFGTRLDAECDQVASLNEGLRSIGRYFEFFGAVEQPFSLCEISGREGRASGAVGAANAQEPVESADDGANSPARSNARACRRVTSTT